MAKLRKLWSTTLASLPDRRRHESRAQAYRYVANDAANWAAGALRSRHVSVWVDERDGRGWKLQEQVDLADYGGGAIMSDREAVRVRIGIDYAPGVVIERYTGPVGDRVVVVLNGDGETVSVPAADVIPDDDTKEQQQ